MTEPPTNSESNQELDLAHIDAALQAQTTRLSRHHVRHYRRAIITVIIALGLALCYITLSTPKQTELLIESPATTPSPIPSTSVATPTQDPNAGLPEEVIRTIAAWPITQPRGLMFKPASTVPASVEDSENLYTMLADFAVAHPEVNFTLIANPKDDSQRQLAELRLEYVQSQLAENKIPHNRVTQTITDGANIDPTQADVILISRSLLTGEKAPQ